jgi:hypothetical protein
MASIETARKFCLSILNAMTSTTTNYGSGSDWIAFPDAKVDDALMHSLAKILAIVASWPDAQWRWALPMEAVAVSHGGFIPVSGTGTGSHAGHAHNYIGPYGAVQVDSKAGRWTAADDVRRLATTLGDGNPLGLTEINGLYGIRGNRIWFIGSQATVDRFFVEDDAGNATIPDDLFNAVVSEALSYIFVLQGDNVPAASHYHQLAMDSLQLIASGKAPPGFVMYEPT